MNGFLEQNNGVMAPLQNTQTAMMISRQAQEVQAAMVVAKRFPRDEVDSFNRIMTSCHPQLKGRDSRFIEGCGFFRA